MRKSDTELLSQDQRVAGEAEGDGTVEKILDKWGLKAQGFLMQSSSGAILSSSSNYRRFLMSGVALTIIVTIGSLALSTVLGLVWALMRVSGIRVLAGVQRRA